MVVFGLTTGQMKRASRSAQSTYKRQSNTESPKQQNKRKWESDQCTKQYPYYFRHLFQESPTIAMNRIMKKRDTYIWVWIGIDKKIGNRTNSLQSKKTITSAGMIHQLVWKRKKRKEMSGEMSVETTWKWKEGRKRAHTSKMTGRV